MSPSLAELVSSRRMAMGYTMRGLASRVGVSSAYIAHIEHGRIDTPSPTVVASLARELQIGEESLLRAIGYLQTVDSSFDMISPAESLPQLIRQAREARMLTQAQVDEAIGMSVGYTGMVESGRITRPRPDTLRKLEAVLGIPRQDMLVATGELDTPSDDITVVLQRIAALPDREQRLEAWALLPEALRTAIMVLLQDVMMVGASSLWESNGTNEQERSVGAANGRV